jgi:hypothetical protein
MGKMVHLQTLPAKTGPGVCENNPSLGIAATTNKEGGWMEEEQRYKKY